MMVGGNPHVYDEDDCLRALQRVADKLGHSPTVGEYRENKKDAEPSANTIRDKWGSWNEAKQQASLDTWGNSKACSKEDVIRGLTRVADELGHSPSKTEYREHKRDSELSGTAIRSMFESWNEAKQQASLDIEPSKKEINHSQKDVLTALTRVADELGHSPPQPEYREHKTDAEPSTPTMEEKFGSWNKAKQQAGLDTHGYSEEDLIRALTRVANKLGHSPTHTEYKDNKKDAEPSTKPMQDKFGSWNEAKRLCSLATYHDGDSVNYPYGPGWSRKAAHIVRESGECLNCGIPAVEYTEQTGRRLDVHHIHKLRSFYQTLSDEQIEMFDTGSVPEQLTQEVEKRTEKANHRSNLVPLCRNCHKSEVEPLSVREQVEMLDVEMPEVSPERAHSSAERNRLRR